MTTILNKIKEYKKPCEVISINELRIKRDLTKTVNEIKSFGVSESLIQDLCLLNIEQYKIMKAWFDSKE